MKNVSNEFRQLLQTDERHYLAYADIVLADGTGFSLDNSQIWTGGLSYEETVSEDNQFSAVGSVIIGSATLVVNNIDEFFSSYDFTNADVVLYIGMQLSDRVERIKIGTYRVDEAVYNGGTVTLKLLDYIEQLDRPYTSSALSYPATLQDILVDACYNCGVLLYNYDFPNKTFTVQNAPDSKESTTFREVVSWVATLAGCFVKCTPDGKLVFQWFDTDLINQYQTQTIYDGGTFNPWTTGDIIDGGTFNPWTTEDIIDGGAFTDLKYIPYVTNLNSQNIDLDDVVITGVSVTIENNNDDNDTLKYSAGTDDYEIVINANPFITKANAQTIINTLGNQLIGLRFRRLNITHVDDPTLEAGDIGIVVDRKQNNYFTLITRVSFTVGSLQTVVCGAATPCRNSVTKYSTQTKNYLKSRKVLKEEQSLRTLLQWDLNAKISSMSGLYTTVENVSGGGSIFYLHDKPTLNESKIVWKMTADAWAVTNNYQGSQTQWTAGLTVDGNLIANILSAIHIDFDWGVGGELLIERKSDHTEVFYANANTGVVRIGRWNIQPGNANHRFGADSLYTVVTSGNYNYEKGMRASTGANDYAFYVIRKTTSGAWSGTIEPMFYVTNTGVVYAANGTFKGRIEASEGSFKGAIEATSGTFKGAIQSGSTITGSTITGSSITAGSDTKTITLSTGTNPMLTFKEGRAYSSYQTAAKICSEVFDNGYYDEDTGYFVERKGSYLQLNASCIIALFAKNTLVIRCGNDLTEPNIGEKFSGVHTQIPRLAANIIRANTLTISGTKNREVETEDYGERLLYSYETPSPMFGDIGEGIIAEDGICYVQIDPVFSETIVTYQYQVFLQKYGEGDCYVYERKATYFIVKGTPNLAFGWEIKAKQSDFAELRLENKNVRDIDVNDLAEDYGLLGIDHIKEIQNERIGN